MILDNQKALKNSFQAATFKVEENSRTCTEIYGVFKEKWNSRTFQGLPLKFKGFSKLCDPVNKAFTEITRRHII